MAQLSERILKELDRIAEENPGKTVVVATHATPIRAVMAQVGRGNRLAMKEIPWVTNASVTELIFENGHRKLGKTGCDEHLREVKTQLAANV